jgi:tetratricopeptide (TPR) repeat protein
MPEPRGLAASYLARATELRKAGRLAESLAPLRQAVALEPANAFACHDLGLTLLHCGQPLPAIEALNRAIAIKPDFAAAYCRLGIALAAAGHPEKALKTLQEAIVRDPRQSDAHAALAPLLLDRGQRRAAAEAYRRAGGLARDTPVGRLNLVRALVIEERDNEAEVALRRAVALDPKNSAARWMLGNLHSEAGRFVMAESEFAAAVAIDPRQAVAWYDLVRCRRLGAADHTLIERMEAALPGLTRGDTRALMHLALGKAFDDLGDPGAAMRHFSAGNAAKPDPYNFDRRRLSERFDALIARFTPDLFRSHVSQASSSELPVLILGLPRSGTTLVEQIVASHPAVCGGGEMLFWEHQGRAFSGLDDEAMIPFAISRIAEEGLRVLREVDGNALRVTDKTPWNFRWAGLIHLAFPAARIIHCRRSPIDTCLSMFQTYFAPRPDFSTEAEDLVFYHGEYERLMAHWRAALPAERFFEIEYEKLIAAPEPTSRRMISFLGLEWDDACLQPERNPRRVKTASKWQARQAIYASALERWRRYQPFLGPFSALLPSPAADDAGNAAPTVALQPEGAQ